MLAVNVCGEAREASRHRKSIAHASLKVTKYLTAWFAFAFLYRQYEEGQWLRGRKFCSWAI